MWSMQEITNLDRHDISRDDCIIIIFFKIFRYIYDFNEGTVFLYLQSVTLLHTFYML